MKLTFIKGNQEPDREHLCIDTSEMDVIKLTMCHPEVLDFEMEFDILSILVLEEAIKQWKEENSYE